MKIAVIGGGAAGLVAAGSAHGADIVLFDHSDKVGKKIYITGKGRCNFTNACDVQEFLQNVVTNASFLRSALFKFSPNDAIALLNDHGCKTKIERGKRAFPLSDKASDVTKALLAYAQKNHVQIRLDSNVKDITKSGDGFYVKCGAAEEYFDRVIVCTGGVSYPSTGSDGSMFPVLKRLGHDVIDLKPSLVGYKTKQDLSAVEGLTLKNVSLSSDGIKPIFGDLMITSDGIGGPITLVLSAYLARREKPFDVYLDLKPALTQEELDVRILKDFSANQNKMFKNALDGLLPQSIIPIVVARSAIAPEKEVNSVTKVERTRLVGLLKRFALTVTGDEGFDRAVVTSGGVNVKQVDPKTMESRIVKGLYFGGEVLDVDALTGGFNMHIALATGYVAGSSAGGYNG